MFDSASILGSRLGELSGIEQQKQNLEEAGIENFRFETIGDSVRSFANSCGGGMIGKFLAHVSSSGPLLMSMFSKSSVASFANSCDGGRTTERFLLGYSYLASNNIGGRMV